MRIGMVAATAAFLVAVGTLTAIPANADDTPSTAEVTATVTDAVSNAVDQGLADPVATTPLHQSQPGIVSTNTSTPVDVATDPASPIVSLRNGTGGAIGIGLPVAASSDPGQPAADGSVVFTDATPGVDVTVQALAGGGVRALTTINTADASQDLVYPLALPNGDTAQVNDTGGVDFVRPMADTGGATVIDGGISAAWAVDANGNEVPTTYEVTGDAVVQHVDPAADAAYPITADPAVYLDKGWVTASWYVSRYWTKRIGAAVGRYGNASPAVIAGVFAAACFPLVGPFAVACGIAGGIYGGFAIDQFVWAASHNECVRFRVVNHSPYTGVLGIYVDNTSYCQST